MSNPQEEIYKEYLNYDWDSFSEFQEGLNQILDNYLENLKEQDSSILSIPALDKHQLIEQAKSFFYCSHTGNILNIDDYEQWKLTNGHKYDKKAKLREITNDEEAAPQPIASTTIVPEVQNVEAEAPKAEDDKSEPPYSTNYQELVELIVSGKPVPGIKEIPDTVLTDQSSTPAAKQRVKPWETKIE